MEVVQNTNFNSELKGVNTFFSLLLLLIWLLGAHCRLAEYIIVGIKQIPANSDNFLNMHVYQTCGQFSCVCEKQIIWRCVDAIKYQ